MFNHRYLAPALSLTAAVAFTPASAAVVVITQAKANAGGVTPGDAPGFPVTLSLPGAYQFDTNLTVPANRNGIVVTSHYVDIDMNGFLLLGANASGVKVAFHGVISGHGDGHIHDGIISSFKGNGIFLVAAPNSNAWVVEDMQIVGNDQFGIRADVSHYLRFSNNLILVNGRAGIVCGEYCHVEGNTLADNGDRWPCRRNLSLSAGQCSATRYFPMTTALGSLMEIQTTTSATATTRFPGTEREATRCILACRCIQMCVC